MNSDPAFTSQIELAGIHDQSTIRYLIENHDYYHHHLDWVAPVDWLGKQPFLILKSNGKESAALACPADAEGIGWIRLFVTLKSVPLRNAWNSLWVEIRKMARQANLQTVAGLAFTDWYEDLLIGMGFSHSQDVVVLSTKSLSLPQKNIKPGVFIRPASREDLPAITALDGRAFDNLWRHTLPIMEAAYYKAGYTSVAEISNEVVGYQLSTISSPSAHLARLAVEPRFQNSGIGRALTNDLFRYCIDRELDEVTVNTQNDNRVSLALYRNLGFELTGEKYPVYILHLN